MSLSTFRSVAIERYGVVGADSTLWKQRATKNQRGQRCYRNNITPNLVDIRRHCSSLHSIVTSWQTHDAARMDGRKIGQQIRRRTGWNVKPKMYEKKRPYFDEKHICRISGESAKCLQYKQKQTEEGRKNEGRKQGRAIPKQRKMDRTREKVSRIMI